MKNEEKGRGKGLLFGIFVGGTVGSIIALLRAPKSGEKLRQDMKIKSKEIIVNAEKYISHTKNKTNKIISRLKRKSSSVVNDVEKNDDSLLDQSETILNETGNKAELYVETGTPEIRNEDKH